MTAPYRSSVEVFCSHFRRQFEEIATLPQELHQNILYCLLLDPLAHAAHSTGEGSRAKFVLLLRTLCHWPDADRVSLFQLTLALREGKRTRFRLYREAKRQLASKLSRDKTPISDSPPFSELEPFVADKSERRVLEMCTYVNLFYTYRSNLVHEFREPGYGFDWGRGSTKPYYGKSAFGPKELVFPVAFVAATVSTAIANLEPHLLTLKQAPHNKFQFGSQWRWK